MGNTIATIRPSSAESDRIKAKVETKYARMDPEIPDPHVEAEHPTFTMCSCCTM